MDLGTCILITVFSSIGRILLRLCFLRSTYIVAAVAVADVLASFSLTRIPLLRDPEIDPGLWGLDRVRDEEGGGATPKLVWDATRLLEHLKREEENHIICKNT